MKFENIIQNKIIIGDIPAIILTPKDDSKLYPTIILYHGWSSNKESQVFRGFILSSLGYQVIIPDAIYHGERQPLSSYGPSNSAKYFWDIIFKNIEESNRIIDYAINNLKGDKNGIGVIGHSMGGFTAAGVFTHNKDINSLVVMNGSLNWSYSNKFFKEAMEILDDFTMEENKILQLDPMNNMDLIKDRPVLFLHGAADPVVDINPQRVFYNEIVNMYNDMEKIKFVEYLGLGHSVTIKMMEEAAVWFEKYL